MITGSSIDPIPQAWLHWPLARGALFEVGYTIRQLHPLKLLTRPDMTLRRKGLRVIEADCSDIDLLTLVTGMPVGQRCPAASAEGSGGRRRRVVLDRLARGEDEILRVDRYPGH